ncbi:unnamed protein product [Adineta ricciae]|uniref:Uncharacterized protein n=1 Tax=Adineta ricciae TaxID=249248 RepID=A0A815V7B7_ADIRI|nr:unnamed protein product [Adineta ricciae]CAF1526806.1 unnamed protein product [Adineta ricciae]
MLSEIKIIIYGDWSSIEKHEWNLPLPVKFVSSWAKLQEFIDGQPESVSYFLILISLFGETLEAVLNRILSLKNIARTFVCDNKYHQYLINQRDIYHLPKRRITYSTTWHAIRTFESQSEQSLPTDLNGVVAVTEQNVYSLKRWLQTNDKVEACDVLIIPIQSSQANLLDFQQKMIEFWTTFGTDFELRVCTLSDYICSDDFSDRMSEKEKAFVDEHNKKICDFLKKNLTSIRIYLIGNEENISDRWSEYMISQDPINHDRCTCYEHEPVTDATLQRLKASKSAFKDLLRPMLRRMDDLRDSGLECARFHGALESGSITMKQREMVANIELSEWSIYRYSTTTMYSSEFRNVVQPQDDRPILANATGDINSAILENDH